MPASSLPLHELTIGAFRGLSGVRLPGLGRVNVLVGENDTGKSSVLEAVRLHLAPTDPGTWIDLCRRRRRDDYIVLRLHASLRLLFPIRGPDTPPSPIRLSSEGDKGSRVFTASLATEKSVSLGATTVKDVSVIAGTLTGSATNVDLASYSKESNPSRNVDVDSGRVELRFSDGELHWHPPLPDAPVVWVRAHESSDASAVVNSFSRTQLSGQGTDFLRLVQLVDPRVTNLQVLALNEFGPELFASTEDGEPIPLSHFGDGLWQGLRVGTAIAAVRGGVVLVDEFDAALHYSALVDVCRWWLDAARRFDVQLFMTTHSLEAVDALLASAEGHSGELVAFRLDRTDSGIVARRFDQPTLRNIRHEGGLELR